LVFNFPEILLINETPRVRFAPSPTGYLHVGGLRTALYNYLFAKKNNGKFVLRIEDTDRNRYVEGAVENLIHALKWCGLDYDEGPDKGGDFGPYMQSQRLDIYKKHALKLIDQRHAYYCFCTPERLENLKKEQQAAKLPQAKYDKHCLGLSKDEVAGKLAAGESYVIRLNVRPGEKVAFTDIIREYVEFDSNNIDDQVLIKGDGYPTYHLANVVDDHLMKITHVVRGEEWLSSTPKHVLLYDYFGWEKPVFAHLPLLLNPDRSKLSKRQGDVAVEDYRAKGYFKEALVNFVSLLGWNAGDDKEFYYLNELAEKFTLERVNKAGAVFDIEKLNWLNAEHLRAKAPELLLQPLKDELSAAGIDYSGKSDDYLKAVITAMKERVSFVKEYIEKSPYFFLPVTTYDEASREKNWKPETAGQLTRLAGEFEKLGDVPAKEDYESALKIVAAELNTGAGKLIHPLRLATSGMSAGPGVYDILIILGKKETISRIKAAVQILGS